MLVVSDTSVITNLYQIDALPILEKLFSTIAIPYAVYEELKKLPDQQKVIDNQDWIKVMRIVNTARYNQLIEDLDKGESEAIVLALELEADALLIDERKGRKIAKEMGVEVTGLLGVLLEAKTEGIISEVKPLIDDLIDKANFRISPSLYRRVIQRAEE